MPSGSGLPFPGEKKTQTKTPSIPTKASRPPSEKVVNKSEWAISVGS